MSANFPELDPSQSPAAKVFLDGLLEEHATEASWLFVQRRRRLMEACDPWPSVSGHEERMSAHVFAMTARGAASMDMALGLREQCSGGALFVAASLACLAGDQKGFLGVLSERVSEGPEIETAVEWHAPMSWGALLANMIERFPKMAPHLLRAAASRRWKHAGVGELIAQSRDPWLQTHPDACWALGRLPSAAGSRILARALRCDDDEARAAAAIAKLRHGDDGFKSMLHREVVAGAHSPMLLALTLAAEGGDIEAILADELRSPAPWLLKAAGLWGSVRTIPVLLDLLAEGTLAGAAAEALEAITGAGLRDAIPAESGDEGVSFGDIAAERLSQDAQRWREWWATNHGRFGTATRFRRGRPMSKQAIVDALGDERAAMWLREACLDELKIRFGVDLRLEISMPVKNQLQVLRGS